MTKKSKTEILVIRSWESVSFRGSRDGLKEQVLLLDINRDSKTYRIMTPSDEMVSFNGDSIEITELKLELLNKALDYIITAFAE